MSTRTPSLFPYVELRRKPDGTVRPRFKPSARERDLGFKPCDLRHPNGAWFTLDEVAAFAKTQLAEIAAARTVAAGGIARREIQRRDTPAKPGRTVADLMRDYLRSKDFDRKKPSTRRDYLSKGDAIIFRRRPRNPKGGPDMKAPRTPELFGTMPAKVVQPHMVKDFYERVAKERGETTGRGIIMVLSAAFAWARLNGAWALTVNPCLRLDLPMNKPRVVVFTIAEIKALLTAADTLGHYSIGDAIMLALFTGQRQADVLSLADKAAGDGDTLATLTADGDPLRFLQGKTGARVAVFATPALIRRLREAEARRKERLANVVKVAGTVAIVLSEDSGRRWNESTFRHTFADVRAKAAETLPSVRAKQFRDLRDTAVTWLANAGCEIPEICSITGHSLASATSILKHYLELGEPLARNASAKMVAWMRTEGMEL